MHSCQSPWAQFALGCKLHSARNTDCCDINNCLSTQPTPPTCNVQRLPPQPAMLLKEALHEHLKVFNGFVIICVVAGLARGIAEPRTGWRVNVQHVGSLGPAVGVGLQLDVLQGRLPAGSLRSCRETTQRGCEGRRVK